MLLTKKEKEMPIFTFRYIIMRIFTYRYIRNRKNIYKIKFKKY